MTTDGCPSHADLIAYSRGSEGGSGTTAEHLSGCARCREAVARLDGIAITIDAARPDDLGASEETATHSPARAGDPFATPGEGATGSWARGDATTPAAGGAARTPPVGGPSQYEVFGRLGAGGMGEVFKARDRRLDRVVALKMMHRVDEAARARFRVEARAVARLQHPNIVQIYEVGEADGAPYLALEYVAGGSLDRALKGSPWAPRRAAEMVRAVASGVQHAHAQGIIHRDLKPANVLLVAPEDPQADATVPKVADFGLARLAGDDSGMTRTGDIMGTPSYMAPEQADGGGDRIGPATDVYSLGVILYELLTGRVPFRGTDAIRTLVLVREAEPVPPRRLDPRLPRDLETICLKCLAKDPSRRYDSAEALGDDLGRWLEGRPIVARPVGPVVRLGLWARRRPAVAALWITVALATLGGLATFLIMQDHARRAAERSAVRERLRFDLATEAIGTFHSKVSGDLLLKQSGFSKTREALLGQARDFYRKLEVMLADEPDRRSRVALAEAHRKLGELNVLIGHHEEAEGDFRRELALREALVREPGAPPEATADLAQAILKVGEAKGTAGQFAEALPFSEKAREMLEPLARDHPGVVRFRRDLADALLDMGACCLSIGRPGESSALWKRSLALREEIVRAEPSSKYDRERLCFTYFNLAMSVESTDTALALKYDARSKEQREILLRAEPDDVESRADMAGIVLHIARVHSFRKDRAGEYAAHAQARDLYEDALRRLPELEQARIDLANLLQRRGFMLLEDRRLDEALPAFQRAGALLERLARDKPASGDYAYRSVAVRLAEAEVLARLGRAAEADVVLAAERDRREATLRAAPRTAAKLTAARLARFLGLDLFVALRRRGTPDEWRGRACALLEEVARDEPKNRAARSTLAVLIREMGHAQASEGRRDEAERSYARAAGLYEVLAREDPENITYRGGDFDASSDRAAMLARLGRDAEALAAFEALVPLTDRLLAEKVTSIRVSRRTDQDAYIAVLSWKTGKDTPADAVARLTSALARAAKTPFATPEVFGSLARCHALRARLAGIPGSGLGAEDGRADLRAAALLLRRAVAAGYPASEVLTDPEFVPVLDSPESAMLRQDLAMPARPFAGPGS